MSKKWKNYTNDKTTKQIDKLVPAEKPSLNDGAERVLAADMVRWAERDNPPKKPFYQDLKNSGALHFFAIVGIFAILVLSISIYQISYNTKEQVVIKLDYVDNYTNYVRDECGNMYTPVQPRLSTSVRAEEKEKDTSVPAILLNESDVYEAIIMSSPAIDGGMFFQEITGFKLTDSSKYIKNC